MNIFDITAFGAVGDGRTLNTQALQKTVDACRQAGGGTVRIPAGTFMTGVFELFSGITLLVEKDGRLLASPRLEDHWVGKTSVGLHYAQDAENIVLTGEGVLDGNAPAFFKEGVLHLNQEGFSGDYTWQKHNGLSYGTQETVHGPLAPRDRPGNMVIFARCRKVRMEKLTVTGAAYWTIHGADCEQMLFAYLKIDNDLRHPNNDGIHLSSCHHVKVQNCQISCGDDAVAVTGFREPAGERQIAFGLSGLVRTSEDIEVADCVLVSRSAGVRIGYGRNPTRNVRLRRLDIRDCNRGIGIFARQADVEDVLVEDCKIQSHLVHGNWWGRGDPLHLSAVRYPGDPQLFHIRHVTLRNIEASGENAVVLYAEEPGAIDEVTAVRVRSRLQRGELFAKWGGNLDLRPAAGPHEGIIAGGTAPLWAIGVSHLRCEDCQWELEENAGPAFSAAPVIRDHP